MYIMFEFCLVALVAMRSISMDSCNALYFYGYRYLHILIFVLMHFGDYFGGY